MKARIGLLSLKIEARDREIDQLSKRRKTEEDLREEIETLRENLIDIGQDHVVDKERIKEFQNEINKLTAEITSFEKQIAVVTSNADARAQVQEELKGVITDYQELKQKFSLVTSNLGMSQRLAHSRFMEIMELNEVLRVLQPEVKHLRQESAELKTAKEELAAKTKDIKDLEKKAKELEQSLATSRQEVANHVSETKTLKDKLAVETEAKTQLEDAQRVSGRDLRKADVEKIELSAMSEKVERELQRVQEQITKLRPRVADLEEQVHKLKREKAAAQEETEFKVKQYTTAQGLLSSMRDQASEMTVQLKEAQSQARSLEEELSEVQHLLQERTREGETMRRLLADGDQHTETKMRDLRSRLEAAIAERERLEDEASTAMRKNGKTVGELKSRVRELEAEAKDLCNEREGVEERDRTLRRRNQELELVESRSEAEAAELRNTISSLRSTLDASEQQVRDGVGLKTALRKDYESLQLMYDKISKELKAIQAKATATATATPTSGTTSRTSMDSAGTSSAGELSEVLYLKTILLQFLEQKDSRLRAQLVPVLGKLLKFDK